MGPSMTTAVAAMPSSARLADQGVDGIITNDPEAASRLLAV